MNSRLYPFMMDLHEVPVLMVGGGRIAARKLPELLACGARITVVSPDLASAMSTHIQGVQWKSRSFEKDDVKGQALVFALTDQPSVNAQVAQECRANGIPCNRADSAEGRTFQTPALLRRGPLTIAIGSQGMAPALSRSLRRHLEVQIGEEWGLLAQLLGSQREISVLKNESENVLPIDLPILEWLDGIRNGLTEGVKAEIQKVYSGGPKSLSIAASEFGSDGNPIAPTKLGEVWLIGAGPGDPELLTIRAASMLREAEVVIYDRLIDPRILALAPASARLIPAGKRGHQPSTRQEAIHEAMIREARKGHRVLRLKGGDPFVFGRGHEEIEALQAAKIPWHVVPGLSSALAVPAASGIPLTHRGLSRSFAVVSATTESGDIPEIPKADTLVILMGLHQLAKLVPALLAAGYSRETPSIAIQDGTRLGQKLCRATLETLAAETTRLGFDSPTLIVLGQVAAFGHKSNPVLL